MTDERMEQIVGTLLRAGVILAAAVVAAGGVWYLWQHGGEQPAYSKFHGATREPFIQLGLILLIATPVTRVAVSVVAFAIERDWLYVGITLVVLTVLIYGLLA